MVKANHALSNSAPGGRKNIFNEYTTKLFNPEPHPPPLPPPPPAPPQPFLTKFVFWKAFYLSKTSPNTILLAFLGKKRTKKAKVK